MRLIPAIDLKGGHCVQTAQGRFRGRDALRGATRASCLPSTAQFGADWLHVVDLDGARDGSGGNRAIIAGLAGQSAVKLQVGGGLRNSAAVAQMLDLGVARVVVGSAALIKADQVRSWLELLRPRAHRAGLRRAAGRGGRSVRRHARMAPAIAALAVGRGRRASPISSSSTCCAPT